MVHMHFESSKCSTRNFSEDREVTIARTHKNSEHSALGKETLS